MRMGWTWLRSPRWSANAWHRKDPTMQANPSSQTPRFRAWVRRLRCIVESAGASSTPIRWSRLVSALANAAVSASA